MDKVEELSVDSVVTKLGLSKLPKQRAYEIIAEYVSNDSFDMYFDERVLGIEATEDVEMVLDEHETVTGGIIGNGDIIAHDGRKLATGVDAAHWKGRFQFVVNAYYFEGERFYPTDSEGVWLRQKLIDVDLVSFDKNQIDTFAKANNFSKGKADQGLLKALALLARDIADNGSAKYKSGNKVNASAFQEHILSLAEKYGTETVNLKSLGDKVKKALREHGLNDTTPKK